VITDKPVSDNTYLIISLM